VLTVEVQAWLYLTLEPSGSESTEVKEIKAFLFRFSSGGFMAPVQKSGSICVYRFGISTNANVSGLQPAGRVA
jgi:hypothetical protein